MANPQHIDWLLEGVEAWNARRERNDFVPDFEGADLGIARPLFRSQILRMQPSGDQSPETWSNKIRQTEANGFSELNLSNARLVGATVTNFHLLRASFENAPMRLADLSHSDLSAADLRHADLEGADLTGCIFLGRADLRNADLRQATFTRAVFSGKHPRGFRFGGKFSGGALLDNANVTTLRALRFLPPDEQEVAPTDLSGVAALTQEQLNSMRGDSGTILPEGLTRPAHWPVLDDIEPEPAAEASAPTRDQAAPSGGPVLSSSQDANQDPFVQTRIRFHIRHARGAALTAEQVAYLLDAEARLLRQGSNQLGPEIDLLDDLVALLRSFATEVSAPDPSPTTLEQQLADAQVKIAELTAKLEAAEAAAKTPSAFRKSFQQSAGKALGTAVVAAPLGAVTGGLAYLLGAGAQISLTAFAIAAASGGICALK